MAFRANVEAHHRLQYAASVTMVAQMTMDRLEPAVTTIDARGEAQSTTDLINAGEYAYGEARSRRNPENPMTGDRRWLIMPPAIESGQYIDKEDTWATATDPTSAVVQFHTNNVMRGKFDRKMGIRKDPDTGLFRVADGGILGYATSGKRPDTKTALPGSQIIPGGSTGLTIEKLRLGKLNLKLNDFGMEDDDPLFCSITPQQEDDLLAIAQEALPYNNLFSIEALRSGKVQSLMGINWIMTNRCPVTEADEKMRQCPLFSKKNIVQGLWQDVEGDMWNDTSAKNLPYAYVSAYTDCVRNQDKGVVVIECLEP